MGSKVDRAEHLGKIAGKRLRLITACEEGKAVGVGGADLGKALSRDCERLPPLDLLEFAGTPRTDTLERLAQPGRRQHVHDTGGTFAAEDSAVHRMVAVSFNVSKFAVLQMNFDAAAAGTHVACGKYRSISGRLGVLDDVFWHESPQHSRWLVELPSRGTPNRITKGSCERIVMYQLLPIGEWNRTIENVDYRS